MVCHFGRSRVSSKQLESTASESRSAAPGGLYAHTASFNSWSHVVGRGPTKHINFFNINFLAPTQNTPFWAPRKKFMCLISLERTQKRDPHKHFWGDLWGQKGVPNGPSSATRSLVYCCFPALSWKKPIEPDLSSGSCWAAGSQVSKALMGVR